MQMGRAAFEAFSAELLALDRLPADASPARLMREGLAGLRRLVPYDAAWWGESSGGMDGLAPRNWLSGRIGLGADFVREWNRIAAADRFALDSMQRLEVVVTAVGYADPDAALEDFARRHDLYHVMAITRTLPGSGLLQFISLYRGQASPRFEPAHRVLFEQFSAHLMQRWSRRVAALVGEGSTPGDMHGLVDATGEFVYIGAALALWLRERHADWDGQRLPPPLMPALMSALAPARMPAPSAPPAVMRLGRRRLSWQRCGELMLLGLAPQRRAAVLPPRELSVALLYAHGHSYKRIARETGLAPATVRTYLRDAYLRLGVSDKVALGRALAAQQPRRAAR